MRILIIKTSSLGDMIQAFPVLDYLHDRYPDAKIDWIVEKPFSGLIEAHPYVYKVLTIQTKKWKRQGFFSKITRQEIKEFIIELRRTVYDFVFDLQGNIKSGLVTRFARSSNKVGFAYDSVPESPNLLFTNMRFNPPKEKNIREDYLFLVRSAMKDFNSSNTGACLITSSEEDVKSASLLAHPYLQYKIKIMVCCGSNWSNKQLPKETLETFLKSIQQDLNCSFLFVWGSSEEKSIVEKLAGTFSKSAIVAEKMALPSLQNLMSKVDLIISMDSLPLHLAGTTSTPTYSIFGPSLANKYKPVGSRHEAFQGACPFGKKFDKRCPILRTCSTGNCIKDIDAKELYDGFMRWRKNETCLNE